MESYSPESSDIQVGIVENRAKIQNFFSLKSVTWKTLPRGGKFVIAVRQLCISEVFRPFFFPKSSSFSRKQGKLQGTKVANFILLRASSFAVWQQAWQRYYFCLSVVRRNIILRQNSNVKAKSRFTKSFYFLSTVFVDNFVENEEINLFILCRQVYGWLNIAL
ncbi:hypothetical protein GTP44_01790 [Duganella sp. FT50W]|uniref:Uncharacterized protein n=1 Tax=Duganella lactea TaxID=2692173 RepID=A0A6L8MDE6_9BURK|nr:hypothetical protein [Duganella lactea]MYM80693.1 hypothetical protein [Duganella lactea]